MRKQDLACILMATRIEAEPFIKGLGLSKNEKKPVPVFESRGIVLSISGIGKSNAAIASTNLINRYGPKLIINLGAAGALSNNFMIGDILHIDRIIEPDRPRLLSLKPEVHKPDTLKGFDLASLATHDRPILSPQDRMAAGRLSELVDMEGAAIVQACRAFEIKAYLFKIVTDTPSSRKMEIIKNIIQTRGMLFKFFIEKIMPAISIKA